MTKKTAARMRSGVITILFTCFIFSSCFELNDPGQNTLLKQNHNKLQSKKAILFLKTGDATTDNSLQVTVADYDYELDKKEVGNAFTVDSDHNAAIQDSSSISFTWLTNDTLQIDYNKKLRTFIQKEKVDDIAIIYVLKE